MSTPHPKRITFGRFLAKLVLAMLLGLFGAMTWLSVSGLPASWVPAFTRLLSPPEFAFQAAAAKLDMWRGIALEQARVYRKGVVGEPAVTAQHVAVFLDARSPLSGLSCLKRIEIRGATVDLPQLARSPGRPDAPVPHRSARRPTTVVCHGIDIDLYDSVIQGISVNRASCRLRREAGRITLDTLSATIRQGPATGTIDAHGTYATGTHALELHLDTSVDPHILLPLVESFQLGFIPHLIRRFEFYGGVPRCSVDIRRGFDAPGAMTVDGTFRFRNGAYRGISILQANGQVRVEDTPSRSLVTVGPIHVTRPEGRAETTFTVDTANDTVTFLGESSLHPAALAGLIGTLTNEVEAFMAYNGPVNIEAQGRVNYENPADTDFEGRVEANRLDIWRFTVDHCAFDVRMQGLTNTVSNFHGTIYSGNANGRATFVLPGDDLTNLEYAVDVTVNDLDFPTVVSALGNELNRDYEGRFDGQVSVRGVSGSGNAHTAVGKGRVGIRNGRVFMLPVFGGLSEYMARIIPGLDFILRQTDASANLTVFDGRIYSDDVEIKGDIISMSGKGSFSLDLSLDYDAQIRLLKSHTLGGKILRPIFYPLSKLFEFRLGGTLDDPKWHLTNFSSDLLEKLGLRKEQD